MATTKKTISDISGFANNKHTINWSYVITHYNLTDEFIIENKQYLSKFMEELVVTHPNMNYNAFESVFNCIAKTKTSGVATSLFRLNIPNHTTQHSKLLLSNSDNPLAFTNSPQYTEQLLEEWLIKHGKSMHKYAIATWLGNTKLFQLSTYKMIDSHIKYKCGELISWNRIDIVDHMDMIEYYKPTTGWELIISNTAHKYMRHTSTFTPKVGTAMTRIIELMPPKTLKSFTGTMFNHASECNNTALINWIINNITVADWETISKMKPIAPELIDKFHDKLNMTIVYGRHKLTTKSKIINQMKALEKF